MWTKVKQSLGELQDRVGIIPSIFSFLAHQLCIAAIYRAADLDYISDFLTRSCFLRKAKSVLTCPNLDCSYRNNQAEKSKTDTDRVR